MISTINQLDERGLTRETKRVVNALIEEVRALRLASGPGLRVQRNADGTVVEVIPEALAEAAEAGEVRRFQVLAVREKYLECARTSEDGQSLSGLEFVMRPRETWPTDGDSYPLNLTVQSVTVDASNLKRTFSITSGTKTFSLEQYIWPTYGASEIAGLGSMIYAKRLPKGGTVDDVNGNKVEWIDLNLGGRHWASPMLETDVCVDVDGTATTKAIFAQRTEVED